MKILRIYVDTSVLGGCFDDEFAPWSNGLMNDFRRGQFKPVLSDVTASEVEQAPEVVRSLLTELLTLTQEVIPVTPDALSLLASYQAHGVLGPRFKNDMLHLARASPATQPGLRAGTPKEKWEPAPEGRSLVDRLASKALRSK